MDGLAQITTFLLCTFILIFYRKAVSLYMRDTSGLLPVATVTDMKALIVCSVVILILSIAKPGLDIPLVFCGMLMLWNVVQIVRISHQINQEIETTAVMKKYESKLLKITYTPKGGRSYTDEYTFLAPVMCYEADGQELESVSQIWSQNCELEEEAEYLICYSAVNPELFWFPEQKSKITLPYVVGLCVSAIFFVCWLAFYFST